MFGKGYVGFNKGRHLVARRKTDVSTALVPETFLIAVGWDVGFTIGMKRP